MIGIPSKLSSDQSGKFVYPTNYMFKIPRGYDQLKENRRPNLVCGNFWVPPGKEGLGGCWVGSEVFFSSSVYIS
jgi:hypothetical protein